MTGKINITPTGVMLVVTVVGLAVLFAIPTIGVASLFLFDDPSSTIEQAQYLCGRSIQ